MNPKTKIVSRGELEYLARGYRVSLSVTDEVIERYFASLDCPKSLAAWLLYKNKEHQQLLDLKTDALDYLIPGDFSDAYAATEFLSKADFLSTGVDTSAVALQAFFERENMCKETNARFNDLVNDQQFTGPCVWLLNATIRKIQVVLNGSLSGSDFNCIEWFESCSWGPGATASLRGINTSPSNKFRVERGITRDLHALVGDLIPVAYPLWGKLLEEKGFLFEVGSRLLTVPKNAKTDRVIAAEPGLNSFFQLGLGKMIQRRLYRHLGLDLSDQNRNQMLCFYGSRANNLATVDFSAASDTISEAVVRTLLPSNWFSILDSCRSRYGRVEGSEGFHKWEKFSSMGNGFTFPLQTLIFMCAALCVCEYMEADTCYVRAYGDDVILPSECFQLYAKFCAFLGFKVNPEKSFSSGPFRESCGSHYYGGVDVKPVYLRKRLTHLSHVYSIANSIRLSSRKPREFLGPSGFCRSSFRRLWLFLVAKVPKKLRIFIPQGYGDVGFVGNFDEAAPHTVRVAEEWEVTKSYKLQPNGCVFIDGRHLSRAQYPRQIEGFLVLSIAQRGVAVERSDLGILLDRLHHISEESLGNREVLRRATKIHISWIFANEWCDIGPWG